tara:strand:+ start:136 stop:540 length:405 start_codon:yes stop_codon:yes gene_type:complete
MGNGRKNIITYGTFDTFHYGHMELLKRASSFGDNLIVAISTDEFNQIKGKKSFFPYAKRKEWVSDLKFVNKVIAEKEWDQKKTDIIKYNIHTLIMGDDWTGKFDDFKKYCEVIYLPRTDGISSTQLKEILNEKN